MSSIEVVLKRTLDYDCLTQALQNASLIRKKVFPKATVLLGLSGFGHEVRVIIPGQSYVMELYEIGSVRLVQKTV